MIPWIAWLVASVSTAAALHLWFRDALRILRDRKNVVDSAAGQLTAFRRRAAETPDDEGVAAVLRRSQSIYTQAVDHYNLTLSRPWIYLPARLMGFRRVPGGSAGEARGGIARLESDGMPR